MHSCFRVEPRQFARRTRINIGALRSVLDLLLCLDGFSSKHVRMRHRFFSESGRKCTCTSPGFVLGNADVINPPVAGRSLSALSAVRGAAFARPCRCVYPAYRGVCLAFRGRRVDGVRVAHAASAIDDFARARDFSPDRWR